MAFDPHGGAVMGGWFVSAFGLVLAWGGSAPWWFLQYASEDARLLVGVEVAAKCGLAPEYVEAVVRARGTINTLRRLDRKIMRRVEIVPDQPGRFRTLKSAAAHDAAWARRLRSSRHIVYWVRSVKSHNPKIVGIAWDRNGKARVFYGEILPP
jgi:hypothetical protein